ncbi:uncharacterized protein LOC119563573 isoform X2 [Chelonia mydas]|uniref:uncharacterized protein LOC119563573 isoform X2 n=1 Tax=Chelonia mydas TaxID=8469 RepID=UPI001CA7FF75|nr:uncharacterized protein LOC119563573 isoform X2 [Chelonia mydas]
MARWTGTHNCFPLASSLHAAKALGSWGLSCYHSLSFCFDAIMFIALVHESLTVLQSPAVLRASPGETVNLSCSFDNRQGSVFKATWTIAPGVVLESHHPFYSGRLNVSDLDLLQRGEVTLTLSELEQRDSGLYQCHISIRQGESGTGAGTELQVMGRNQSDTAPPPSQPHQRQPKGHGSRGAEESESLHYAEIKIQTPGRREHTSNHAQRR